MREIFVPTFRDRVVHHLLANWLRPQLEKLFIYDNYAGREGRGTLFGIRRAEKYMRQVTHNYQKPAYVLKLDIASYFRSIPKERLWERLVSVIPRRRYDDVEIHAFETMDSHGARTTDFSAPQNDGDIGGEGR